MAHSVTVKLIDTPHDGRAWLNLTEMRESDWTVDEVAENRAVDTHSFDLEDIRRLVDKPKVQRSPLTLVSHHGVACIGNGGRFSTFQVATLSDQSERIFVAGSDSGNLIRRGALGRACSSIPVGTAIAGQWESEVQSAALPAAMPSVPAEMVEVPRRVDLVPVVMPAPAEANPKSVAAPAMFQPLPTPASLPRAAQCGKCVMLIIAGILPMGASEGDCLIERAADASLRIATDQPGAKAVYFYPNGPASMLASSDGVSFDLDKPLTVSADRTCMKTVDGSVQIRATGERPATLLNGLNGLVAGLFGAAVQAEQRLGLLGQRGDGNAHRRSLPGHARSRPRAPHQLQAIARVSIFNGVLVALLGFAPGRNTYRASFPFRLSMTMDVAKAATLVSKPKAGHRGLPIEPARTGS